MDATVCFVCGGSVSDVEIYMSVGKTSYSKTTYPTKICQMVGDDIMVVVSKDDKLCERCATLIDRFDQLEIDLLEIKTLITRFLSEKYNIISGEDIEYASEELEYSKETDELVDKDTLVSFIKTLENDSPPGGCELQFSPFTFKKNEADNNPSLKEIATSKQDIGCTLVNNPSLKEIATSKQDIGCTLVNNPSLKQVATSEPVLDCTLVNNTLVKTEQFRDCCSSEQSLKTSTKIHLTNNLSKELIKCKEIPSKLSLTETTNVYSSNEKFDELSPVCTSLLTTSFQKLEHEHLQDEYTLKEVKKETDLLEHSNINNPVIERLKYESMPDTCQEFVNGNINNHFDLTNDNISIISPLAHLDNIVSIKKSNSNSGLVNTEAKRIPMKVLSRKTKHLIHFKSYKRKLRPILPKINSNLLESNLFDFDNMTKNVAETSLGNKTNKSLKHNPEIRLGKKCAENVALYEEHNKILLINKIKEEGIQENVSAEYCCRLCKTEFEDLSTLKNHEEQHFKNGIPFCCCFCSKTFKSKSGLRSHTASIHTKKFRFCCEICGQGFTNQSSLEGHHSSHTKEHVYVCDICGKKFNSNGTYWIHRKWHFDPLPYRCSDCGQLFKHSSLLSLHKRRKHTGERPYKCPYCILTFNISSTYKRHLILHTKNYPYNCVVCKQGFTTRFKYTEHMLKVHSVIIDKPKVKKKDYKVVVFDEMEAENEDLSLTANISVADSLVKGLSEDLVRT